MPAHAPVFHKVFHEGRYGNRRIDRGLMTPGQPAEAGAVENPIGTPAVAWGNLPIFGVRR
jgi:hypothetical protein